MAPLTITTRDGDRYGGFGLEQGLRNGGANPSFAPKDECV
jgi:hypothetical protein